VLVVVVIPLLLLFWTGETVGSSAGASLSQAAYGWRDIVLTAGLAFAGMGAGKVLRLPASVLIGPLALSAAMQGAGLVDVVSPVWLLNLSQLVVGVGLGAGFAGVSRSQLVTSMSLGALSVSLYIVLAVGFAWALSGFSHVPVEALFISFAPGGVTEMSLIALSLNIGPIVVAAHHVFRISCTVVLMSITIRILKHSRSD
jgi:membrane AbrB-like protein